jgi:large subunit ribosomal protein L23
MNQEKLLNTLLAPVVSEKATLLGSHNNQYIFKVVKDATKKEIASSIEMLFSVNVLSIQVMNVKGKVKMFGRREGRRVNWKKAIVRLSSGQIINISGLE